jgi:hypothetical protein
VAFLAQINSMIGPFSCAANAAPPTVECAGIVDDRNGHPQYHAAFHPLETFHDVHLIRVQRPLIVHEGIIAQSDRIDDQCIALVTADRFLVP